MLRNPGNEVIASQSRENFLVSKNIHTSIYYPRFNNILTIYSTISKVNWTDLLENFPKEIIMLLVYIMQRKKYYLRVNNWTLFSFFLL